MTEQELLNILQQHEQYHILDRYCAMSSHQKNAFLQTTLPLDIDLAFKLHKDFCSNKRSGHTHAVIRPSDVIELPKNSKEINEKQPARIAGESLLRQQKVAALVVAGGQGSRLGFDGPKGTFPLSPVMSKTLFQLFAEQVKALSIRYNTTVPLLIMTSDDNHADTIAFFKNNHHFGLPPDNVSFFSQGVLPALSPDGKLVLKDNVHLYTSPNGHGGSLKAISDSGILSRLIDSGYEELFYFQVDNPLVKIADPLFLGHHALAKAQVSTKVVRRTSVEEKVGVYLNVNGKDAIIEYSDLDEKYMSAFDEKGGILYWAGNTAIHVFSLSFIERLNRGGFALPYHCAKKSAYIVSSDWEPANVDIWKFETFVFDAIPLAERTCCMEVDRGEEFAPVKNKNGADSPETARKLMIKLHREWLKQADINPPSGAKVEISPIFALDQDEFIAKARKRKIPISRNLYIE